MMTNTPYNLPSSTLGQMALAGALALQSLPAIAQQDIAKQSKCMFGASYRATTNASTYSHFSSLFTGEYHNAPVKLEKRSWMTPELADFLLHSSHVSLEALDYLLVAIRDTYGDVQIDTAIHIDPEEGWSKPVFTVHSGVDNFDRLMDVEDSFFAKAANDPNLLAVLPLVVVSQA
jgi:hypothetical protein